MNMLEIKRQEEDGRSIKAGKENWRDYDALTTEGLFQGLKILRNEPMVMSVIVKDGHLYTNRKEMKLGEETTEE